MNKREIRALGLERGISTVNCMDLIPIGDYVDGHAIGESGRVLVTTNNWFDVHTALAYECESNNRQFSPFEYLAHDLNCHDYKTSTTYDVWNEFDESISRGITKALKKRWQSICMTKDEYFKSFDGSLDLFDTCWRKLNREIKHGTELDFNNSSQVEEWLETIASELVNDSGSRFYIYG